MSIRSLIYFLPVFIIFSGCFDQAYYFMESREIGSWETGETINFENILAKSPSEVVIAVETTEEYAYENIYLKALITTSKDTLFKSTFSIQLMNSGYWLGERRGKVFHMKERIDSTSNVEPLNLNIQIEQFSREQYLDGVERVLLMLKAL